MSEPFSQVSLFAAPTSGGASLLVGQAEADSTGAWTINTGVLADGSYVITAMAIDQYHETTATTQILPNATQGPLTIDTVGPTVTAVRIAPNSARSRDLPGQPVGDGPGPGAPGGQLPSDRAEHAARGLPGRHDRGTPGGPPGPDTVVLSINPSRQLRGGVETFTVVSGAGATGIRDMAGNALDGEFSGALPSGNNIPGGNFVAQLNSVHHTVFAPKTIIGHATPKRNPGTPATGSTIPVAANGGRDFVDVRSANVKFFRGAKDDTCRYVSRGTSW